jgi:hypothetical protein
VIEDDVSSTANSMNAGTTPDTEPHPKRWLALAVIAVTVLMVILDATIVNIALPRVSEDLGVTAANQQWIVTAYTLTFGGFLLLGGRVADFWGRKRTYLVGAAGFAVASALGGVATNEEMLFGPAHRAVHRRRGAGQGLRRLRRDRRRRLGRRPAAGRGAHRVRRLALVLLG